MPTALPDALTSPRGKLVYLFLETAGGATIEELKRGLDVPKLTLLGVLRALEERGVVAREGRRYVTARPA